MTTTNTGWLQLAGVEHFHEQAHRPADLALASLPLADRALVADAKMVSKAGLCEPGPLSDRLEGGGGHSGGDLADIADDVDLRIAVNECVASSGDTANEPLVEPVARAAVREGRERRDTIAYLDRAAESDGFGELRHFHSPVSGGARPRLDETDIGPLGLVHKHNRTRFVAFFTGNTGGDG